jgi:hypothetical protein
VLPKWSLVCVSIWLACWSTPSSKVVQCKTLTLPRLWNLMRHDYRLQDICHNARANHGRGLLARDLQDIYISGVTVAWLRLLQWLGAYRFRRSISGYCNLWLCSTIDWGGFSVESSVNKSLALAPLIVVIIRNIVATNPPSLASTPDSSIALPNPDFVFEDTQNPWR